MSCFLHSVYVCIVIQSSLHCEKKTRKCAGEESNLCDVEIEKFRKQFFAPRKGLLYHARAFCISRTCGCLDKPKLRIYRVTRTKKLRRPFNRKYFLWERKGTSSLKKFLFKLYKLNHQHKQSFKAQVANQIVI